MLRLLLVSILTLSFFSTCFAQKKEKKKKAPFMTSQQKTKNPIIKKGKSSNFKTEQTLHQKQKNKDTNFKAEKTETKDKKTKDKNFGSNNNSKGSNSFLAQGDGFKNNIRKERKEREKSKSKKSSENNLFKKGVLPKRKN